jgi:hypothetical protein
MKLSPILSMLTHVAAAWLVPAGAAHADMIIYDSMTVFQGQQAFTDSFNVSTPGTLTVTVTGVPWLDTVTNLSFFMSSPTGTVGSTLAGAGTESISLNSPGTYSANWFGNAQGLYDLGVVGVNIEFRPNGTPVPLPASILLMLSGLGLLFAWPRIAPSLPTPRSADLSVSG